MANEENSKSPPAGSPEQKISPEQKTSSDQSNPARKRSAPPTIDLQASEVPGSAKPSAADPAAASQASAAEKKPADDRKPATSSAKPQSAAVPLPQKAGAGFGALFAAALCGAAVVAIAAGALWYAGLIQTPGEAGLATRLARIEAQSRNTQAANKTLEDLGSRVAQIETAASSAAAGSNLAPRIAALEASSKSVGVTVSAFAKRDNDTAAAVREVRAQVEAIEKSLAEARAGADQQKGASADQAELARLTSRLAALDTSMQSLQQSVKAQDDSQDRLVRQALLSAELRDAVARGAPYATELAAIKKLGADTTSISALEPFAAHGVPAAATLAAELGAVLSKMAPQPEANHTGSFTERLQSHVGRLVRIRPVGDVEGDHVEAIIARAEARAKQADIDGALSELSRLTPQQRAAAGEWMARAQARQAALAAARDISTKALAALAQTVKQ